MSYLLLLKFVTPSGDISTWKLYGDLEAARLALALHIRVSEQYKQMPGIYGPILVQHCLLKVEEVPGTPDQSTESGK